MPAYTVITSRMHWPSLDTVPRNRKPVVRGDSSMTIHIQEEFINKDLNSFIDTTDVYDTGRNANEKGKLFRNLQREYGRCTGKVYIDTTDGNTRAIGWVFEGRDAYSDVPHETYLREVWVTLHDAPPTETVEYHYLTEES